MTSVCVDSGNAYRTLDIIYWTILIYGSLVPYSDYYLCWIYKSLIWYKFGAIYHLEENNVHESRARKCGNLIPVHFYRQKTNQWCTWDILFFTNEN